MREAGLAEGEKTGRMNMVEIPDSEYVIDCEVVLIAAGFLGSQKYVADSFGVELNERTNVKTACPAEYATNVPKVFVAGDMHRGAVACRLGDSGRQRSGCCSRCNARWLHKSEIEEFRFIK